MKSYFQFCPLAQATRLLCERWTLLVIRELVAGSTRFGELQRGLPQMSPTLLSARLKHLVSTGVISKSPDHEYTLTESGRALKPIVQLMGAWGHRWAPSRLGPEDLDAGLLMWDMRRTVDVTVFPQGIVVQFIYADAPNGMRNWWLISEKDGVELCLQDPGHDVDIVVSCSLIVMTSIWICQRTLEDAVRHGDIKILGNPALTRRLQQWLGASGLSALGERGDTSTLLREGIVS